MAAIQTDSLTARVQHLAVWRGSPRFQSLFSLQLVADSINSWDEPVVAWPYFTTKLYHNWLLLTDLYEPFTCQQTEMLRFVVFSKEKLHAFVDRLCNPPAYF